MSWSLPNDIQEPIDLKTELALQRAKTLGTVNKNDRSLQYSRPTDARPEALLEAVNAQGNHIRGLQADKERIQRQVFNLKLRNSIVVALVTGAIARGPELYLFLLAVLRWLGL